MELRLGAVLAQLLHHLAQLLRVDLAAAIVVELIEDGLQPLLERRIHGATRRVARPGPYASARWAGSPLPAAYMPSQPTRTHAKEGARLGTGCDVAAQLLHER